MTLARAVILGLLLLAACQDGEDGDWSFSHQSFFVVAGAHRDFACEKCHEPAAPSFSLAGGGVDCLGCHTSAEVTPIHADVGDFQWANASCIGCHKSGAGVLPANHDAELFPVTGTRHATISCGQCHGATRAVADLACVPCHTQAAMASKHGSIPATTTGRRTGAVQPNYQWASPYCVRCHADGQVNRIGAHPSVRHGLSGDGHAPFCLTCHGSLRTTTKKWGANFSSYSCLACHTDNNGGGGD